MRASLLLLLPSGVAAVTGTGAVSIGAPAIAGSGTYTPAAITGTGAVSIGPPALAGADSIDRVGTGALAISGPQIAGSGTYTPAGITGTGALAIGAPVLAGSDAAPGMAGSQRRIGLGIGLMLSMIGGMI